MAERTRPLQDSLERRDTHGWLDDFEWYVTAHRWTSLAADTNATVTTDADAPGGVLVIQTGDATDNNECAVLTTNEIILPANNKPWNAEARIQFTEINTSAANICFSVADNAGAVNQVLDNGSNLASSWYGAAIYKLDGETTWRVATSAGTFSSTGFLATSSATAGGTSYQTLRIQGLPTGRSNASDCTFFVDDVQLVDSTTSKPITLTLTHAAAGTGDCNLGVYAKAGAANTVTLNVDYAAYAQKR